MKFFNSADIQFRESQRVPSNMASQSGTFQMEFQGIDFCRGGRQILNAVSLNLNSQDFILMTGQNGSGKSTLLKIISGLLEPDNMEIQNSGKEPQKYSRIKSMLREQFCYLHQTPYLFVGSVYDNIAYGLKRQRLSSERIEKKVTEALQAISLVDLKYRDSRALSGGEKQRVAIARSWVIRPRFILLDEPFANMDKHSRRDCYDLINQLKEDNIGVILTSHDPQDGELNFNRHLHLYQGSLSEKNFD